MTLCDAAQEEHKHFKPHKAVEETKKCIICKGEKKKSEFLHSNWIAAASRRRCKLCEAESPDKSTKKCNFCNQEKTSGAYTKREWKKSKTNTKDRRCKECKK